MGEPIALAVAPNLKKSDGNVRTRLDASAADVDAVAAWEEFVRKDIQVEHDEDQF